MNCPAAAVEVLNVNAVVPSNTLIVVPLLLKLVILPLLSAGNKCAGLLLVDVTASEPSVNLTIVISSLNEPAVAVTFAEILLSNSVAVNVAVSPEPPNVNESPSSSTALNVVELAIFCLFAVKVIVEGVMVPSFAILNAIASDDNEITCAFEPSWPAVPVLFLPILCEVVSVKSVPSALLPVIVYVITTLFTLLDIPEWSATTAGSPETVIPPIVIVPDGDCPVVTLYCPAVGVPETLFNSVVPSKTLIVVPLSEWLDTTPLEFAGNVCVGFEFTIVSPSTPSVPSAPPCTFGICKLSVIPSLVTLTETG